MLIRKEASERTRAQLTCVGIISALVGAILAFLSDKFKELPWWGDILVGLIVTIILFVVTIFIIKCRFTPKLVD